MAIRLIYESGVNGETTDITGYLPLYSFDMTEHAEEGSVALSSLTLDDPNGELDIVGWRRLWAYEDTATGSNSLIHYGWIGDKHVERGPSGRTGSGRLWTVSVADQNVVLGFRVLTAAQVNRPAETDVARVNWLMGFVDWFGRAPITVDEFTFDANGVQMDAVDYRGQTAYDILSDCANQSGKNFYCYTKDNGYPSSEPTRGIWYGSMAHTAYSSPLRLTNVAASVDSSLTFAISDDTQLERKADRVYSGAYVRYDGGAVYEQNSTTFNNFTQRDAVVEASNVKSSGAATRRANRYLADLNSEEDRITTKFYCPASKVNFVKPGMRIQFQATHFPDYEVFNWMRVLSKQVAEVAEHEETQEPHYLVTLVLAQNDPPQTVAPPASGPDVVLEDCNTVTTDANRNALDSSLPAQPIDPGEVWFFSITNTVHDPTAYTEFFYINAGSPSTRVFEYIALPVFEQGLSAPFATWAGRTGTFSLPPGTGAGGVDFETKADYAGPPAVDECWRVELIRIS